MSEHGIPGDRHRRRAGALPRSHQDAREHLTLEQLERLGITVASVTDRLARSFKGWLCTDRDEVVGFCMADRSTGELWVIAVLPKYEKQGIGNRLMGLAESALWASACPRAWLTTDIDTTLRAYGFYRRRGWTDWKIEGGLRYMQLLAPGSLD